MFSPCYTGAFPVKLAICFFFSSGVISLRLRYGFLPNRKGCSGHSSTVHSFTSFALPQQQSRHFSRMTFTGFVCMIISLHFLLQGHTPGVPEKGGAAFLFFGLKMELDPQVYFQHPAVQLEGLMVHLGKLNLLLLLIQPIAVNLPLRHRDICNHTFDHVLQNNHSFYSVTRPLQP